jgi:hypothetical protein
MTKWRYDYISRVAKYILRDWRDQGKHILSAEQDSNQNFWNINHYTMTLGEIAEEK